MTTHAKIAPASATAASTSMDTVIASDAAPTHRLLDGVHGVLRESRDGVVGARHIAILYGVGVTGGGLAQLGAIVVAATDFGGGQAADDRGDQPDAECGGDVERHLHQPRTHAGPLGVDG